MARLTARERRESYLREYAYQKQTGKPFFAALYHDVVVNLFFVLLIIGLAVLWKETSVLGPLYETKADLAVPAYDPKPEWYYFFLFQLLKVFDKPDLLLFGTIIVPSLWMGLLIGMPFIDRTRERRVSRRPIAVAFAAAMAVLLLTLTYKGSAGAGLGGTSKTPGSTIFALNGAGCAGCHALKDIGSGGGIGPNLDTKHPNYARVVYAVSNGLAGGMPVFKGRLSDAEIKCVATYVSSVTNGGSAASAGTGGAPSTPTAACAGVTK